jgi:hypothetical protein
MQAQKLDCRLHILNGRGKDGLAAEAVVHRRDHVAARSQGRQHAGKVDEHAAAARVAAHPGAAVNVHHQGKPMRRSARRCRGKIEIERQRAIAGLGSVDNAGHAAHAIGKTERRRRVMVPLDRLRRHRGQRLGKLRHGRTA